MLTRDLTVIVVVVVLTVLCPGLVLAASRAGSDAEGRERGSAEPERPQGSTPHHPGHEPPETPEPAVWEQNHLYPFVPDYSDSCSCNCNQQRSGELTNCEWKVVFKEVRGSGRNIRGDYEDYFVGINKNLPHAKDISSPLPYRNDYILDNWRKFFLKRTKLEVFKDGERKAWFFYDAKASNQFSWMADERLISSSYTNIKEQENDVHEVWPSTMNGIFAIIQNWNTSCSEDCGYLWAIDYTDDEGCEYQSSQRVPFFLYSPHPDRCAYFDDPEDSESADSIVLSVMACDHGLPRDIIEKDLVLRYGILVSGPN